MSFKYLIFLIFTNSFINAFLIFINMHNDFVNTRGCLYNMSIYVYIHNNSTLFKFKNIAEY